MVDRVVEYDVCLCYGVMISEEVARKILQEYSNDDYCEDYLRCVDAWTNDQGWFFGLTKTLSLGNETFVLPFSDSQSQIAKFKIHKFEQFVYNEHLEEVVNWNPQYYIIQFCY